MAKTFLRVFLPFLLAVFLGSFFSSVNGILSVYLIPEFHLSKAWVGAIFSSSLLFTALMQFPLGTLIDFYGARRIQIALLLIASVGMGIFAGAWNPWMLWLGCFLMGIGLSGGLMAGFKALRPYVALTQIPLIDGLILSVEVAAGLIASLPTVMLLHVISWRSLLLIYGFLTLLMAFWFYWFVPDSSDSNHADTPRLKTQLLKSKAIFTSGFFWKVVLLVCFAYGSKTAFMGLWVVPWLHSFHQLTLMQIAKYLLAAGIANCIGDLSWGFIAERLGHYFKWPVTRVICIGSLLFIVMQILLMFRLVNIEQYWPWILFGFCNRYTTLAYAALTQRFEQKLIGSTTMAMNIGFYGIAFLTQFGMGLVPYTVGFSLIIGLQILGLLFYVLSDFM